jgi:hypothetical protein
MSNDPRRWLPLGFTVEVNAAGTRATVPQLPPARTPPPPPESTESDANAAQSGEPATEEPPVPPPTLAGMAASFATSMAKFAASGFKTTPQEIHAARVAECDPCKYRDGTRCKLCGCFVDKKAWMPHEDCPIGRWPA